MRAKRKRSSSSDSSSAVDMSSCSAVAKPPTRWRDCGQAQARLLVQALGDVADPGGHPAQGGRDLRGLAPPGRRRRPTGGPRA